MSQQLPSNDNTYSFTANVAATNLKATPGVLGRVAIHTVGTTATLDIYDSAAGTDRPLWSWVSADGKVNLELNVRFGTALRFVTTGAAPCKGFVTYT